MRTLQLALAAILIPSAAASLAADAPRPNILMIVGDDMGYADVGFQGCKDIPTPHLDALAASGVRFASGYVSGRTVRLPGPVCSRAATRRASATNSILARQAPACRSSKQR